MPRSHMVHAGIREGAFVEAVRDGCASRGLRCQLAGCGSHQVFLEALTGPGHLDAKSLQSLMAKVVERIKDSEPRMFLGPSDLCVEVLPQRLRKGSNIVLRRPGWEIGIGVHGTNKDTINHRIWTNQKDLFLRMGVGDYPDTPEYTRIETGAHQIISRLQPGGKWSDIPAVKDALYEMASASLRTMIQHYATTVGTIFAHGLFGALVGTERDYYHVEVVDAREANLRAFNCNNGLGIGLTTKIGVPRISWPKGIKSVDVAMEKNGAAHNWVYVEFSNGTTGMIRIHNPADRISKTLKLGGRLDSKHAGERLAV